MNVFKNAIKITLINISSQMNSSWRILRIKKLYYLLRYIKLFLKFWKDMILVSIILIINQWGSIQKKILILLINLHHIWLERGNSRNLWGDQRALPRKEGHEWLCLWKNDYRIILMKLIVERLAYLIISFFFKGV
jgi:hypothetical protein